MLEFLRSEEMKSRLKAANEAISSLRALDVTARYHFDQQVKVEIRSIELLGDGISIAVLALSTHIDFKETEFTEADKENWHIAAVPRDSAEDDIGARLQEAIKTLEDMLVQYLR
jgi:hypothetical protein